MIGWISLVVQMQAIMQEESRSVCQHGDTIVIPLTKTLKKAGTLIASNRPA